MIFRQGDQRILKFIDLIIENDSVSDNSSLLFLVAQRISVLKRKMAPSFGKLHER